MLNTDFVHLHVHTEYSLLDGANRIKDLIAYAKELGMDSMAITDHGVMYGVVDFYKTAVENGVKPILGCEVYVTKGSRFDKQPGVNPDQGHLILLAENNTGYKNLMKIVTAGCLEGFYYKPRVDYEVLENNSEGIIALSACLSGHVAKAILAGNVDEAREIAIRYRNIFGDNNFFFEIQSNSLREQAQVNQQLILLSQELNIPLVATNDAHYLRKEDAKAHDVLLCIQTGKTVDQEDRMKFPTDDFYIKSREEMKDFFKDVPEAIENTVKIAERCNVELDFDTFHLPEYDVPGGKDAYEYLKEICEKGFKEKYSDDDGTLKERLYYELNTIKEMGYVDYFLIVWDFIHYARSKNIPVGPGRGSAAGSIVSYCLEITNVDPIKYGLIFERFLNPERVTMPDIDIDFCYERRQEVIDYVVEKYGADRVTQIITFGTMAARLVIRDVGRALNIPYAEVDAIAKMIPMEMKMTIEKAMEMSPELRASYENDDRIKELIDTSKLLEGMPRHASTHAAGVVISKEPVVEYLPLQKNDDCITTQFPKETVEDLGLLKMDFLGLRTLTVIRDTVDIVEKSKGIKIDIDNIDINDSEVYKLISSGKTLGVFQLESVGMRQFMKELSPTSIEDIIAGISLYRPGPMEQIPKYIEFKKNPDKIKYHHPLLENILNMTYGCMVYQEQVMQIVRDLAGYSMGRSDLVRRAMSKKKADIMEKERHNFVYGITDEKGNIEVEGAIRRGVDEQTAHKIYDEMMDFASYAFNKSHAAAYAIVGYQTAWLKRYYPIEFMAACLNSYLGSNDKISQYIDECKKNNIEILPPDINQSELKFSVHNDKIRFSLASLKNVGEGAVKQIVSERESGEYKDFVDFIERIDGKDVNKRCVESLIKSGAFDSFGIERSKYMAMYEKIIDGIQSTNKRNIQGQMSLFDNSGMLEEKVLFEYPDIKEFDSQDLLLFEKEVMGIYISGHPLSDYRELLENRTSNTSQDFFADSEEGEEEIAEINVKDGQNVIVGGMVESVKTKTTKNNNVMAFVMIEDLYGQIEVIVFPNVYERFSSKLKKNSVVLIKGRVSMREGEDAKLICEDIKDIEEESKQLYIAIDKGVKIEDKRRIMACINRFKGNSTVNVKVADQEYKKLEAKYNVNICNQLIKDIAVIVGNDNVFAK